MSVRYVTPTYTPEGKAAQTDLFSSITSGIEGRGLTPELTDATKRARLDALDEQAGQSKRDTQTFIERNVQSADVGVQSFLRRSAEANVARERESINTDDAFAKYDDTQTAKGLAFGALDVEKGISSELTQIANESALRKELSPSFQSELMGGLGGAAGIYAAGGLSGDKGFFGVKSVPEPTAAQRFDFQTKYGTQGASGGVDFDVNSLGPSPVRYATGMSSNSSYYT